MGVKGTQRGVKSPLGGSEASQRGVEGLQREAKSLLGVRDPQRGSRVFRGGGSDGLHGSGLGPLRGIEDLLGMSGAPGGIEGTHIMGSRPFGWVR